MIQHAVDKKHMSAARIVRRSHERLHFAARARIAVAAQPEKFDRQRQSFASQRAGKIGGKYETPDKDAGHEIGPSRRRRDPLRQCIHARRNLSFGKQEVRRAHSPARAKTTSRSWMPDGGLDRCVRNFTLSPGAKNEAGEAVFQLYSTCLSASNKMTRICGTVSS